MLFIEYAEYRNLFDEKLDVVAVSIENYTIAAHSIDWYNDTHLSYSNWRNENILRLKNAEGCYPVPLDYSSRANLVTRRR